MLPAWLIVGFLALAFLGAGYLFWNSGGFSAKVFNPARVAWDGAGSWWRERGAGSHGDRQASLRSELRGLSSAERPGGSGSVSAARGQ